METTDQVTCSASWGRSKGVLVLTKSGLLWRSRQTEAQQKVGKDELRKLQWCAVGKRYFHLKVTTKSGKTLRFAEVKPGDMVMCVRTLLVSDNHR